MKITLEQPHLLPGRPWPFGRGATRLLSPSDRPEQPCPRARKSAIEAHPLGVLVLLYNLKKGPILHDLPEFKFLRRGLTSDLFRGRYGRRLFRHSR